VGIARPLIADPDFPAKILSGREAQVRPCVSCNEDCRTFDPLLLCSVNPELAPPGMEHRPAAPLVVRRVAADGDAPVAIVGAGPAGLECATALAGRCEIVVFDERAAIGGHLAIAAAAPNRHGWRSLLDFYAAALEAAAVPLRLGVQATAADLEGFAEVVLAVGSVEVLPPLPGIERAVSASAALGAGTAGTPRGSEMLIVDDGFGSWSCASAVELGIAAGAARITIATPSAGLFASLPAEGRVQLLARLRGAPLELRPAMALEAITGSGAELRNLMSDETETIPADTVIVVGERRARDYTSLLAANATVRVIGDALVPRRVAHAISEGRAAAEAITRAASHAAVKAPA
jgi:2,4-dienoyl-CoA reductase (NADPH2)